MTARSLDETMDRVSMYLETTLFEELTEHVGRLIDAAGATRRVVAVEAGHVSLEVSTTAKGEYTPSVKVVMPFFPGVEGNVAASEVERCRLIAQRELEAAEAFLRERYSRKEQAT